MHRLAIAATILSLVLGANATAFAQLQPASGPVALGNGAKVDVVELDGDCTEEEIATALNEKSHWFEKWIVLEYLDEVSGNATWGIVTIEMTLAKSGTVEDFAAKPEVSSGTTEKLRETVESIDFTERVGSNACTLSVELMAGVAPFGDQGKTTMMEALQNSAHEPSGDSGTILGSFGASNDPSTSSEQDESDESGLTATVALDSPRSYCTGGSMFERVVEHRKPEFIQCARKELDALEGTTRTTYRASKQPSDPPDASYDVTREEGPEELESCMADVLEKITYSRSVKNDSCAVDIRITFEQDASSNEDE